MGAGVDTAAVEAHPASAAAVEVVVVDAAPVVAAVVDSAQAGAAVTAEPSKNGVRGSGRQRPEPLVSYTGSARRRWS
jgi:hypothetical protein